MSKAILWVGLGGFVGSTLRYALGLGMDKFLKSSFPYATLTVNLLGCFIIGLLIGLSDKHSWFASQGQLLLGIGFCGGFTTFSGFAYENIGMLQQANYVGFFLYSAISFLIGLLAVWGGITLTKI